MINQVKEIIVNKLPNATVYVFDPYSDGEHFEAIVVDASFDDLSLVKQHQIVMNALKEQFASTVHALALKTFGLKKWSEQKHNYQHLIKE